MRKGPWLIQQRVTVPGCRGLSAGRGHGKFRVAHSCPRPCRPASPEISTFHLIGENPATLLTRPRTPAKHRRRSWLVPEGTSHGVTARVQPNYTRQTVMGTDLTGSKGQLTKAIGLTRYEKYVAMPWLRCLLVESTS